MARDASAGGSRRARVHNQVVLLRLLRRQLRPYARLVVAVLLLQLVATAASLYLPSLNAAIIDQGIVQTDLPYIWRVGALMLGVSAVQAVAQIGATWAAARTAMGVGRDVRAGLVEHVLGFSSRELGEFGAPSLITRSTNDVQQVQQVTFMALVMLVAAPITAVGGVIMAVRQDVGLSPLIAVAVTVLLLGMALIIRRMVPLFRAQQVQLDAVNRVLREQITGIRVIRAFTREEHERERFHDTNTELTGIGLRVGDLMALMFPFVMLVMNLSSVGVIWFGAQRVEAGAMEVGALTAYISYLIQILMSIMMATMVATMIPRASVSAERIGAVLETDTTVVAPASPSSPDAERPGTVQLDELNALNKECDEKIKLVVEQEQSKVTASLVSGKTEAMAADSPISLYAVKQQSEELEALGETYDSAPYGIVIPKDQTEFGEAIAAAFASMKEDGSYDAILKNWGNETGGIDDFAVNP